MKSKRKSSPKDPDALTPAERQINRAAWRNEIKKGTLAYFRALRAYGIPDLLRAVSAGSLEREIPPGVTTEAWQAAKRNAILPIKVFAFPKNLVENPKLLGYYRRLAGASMKATRNVVGDPKLYETGERASLSDEQALAFAELFNSAISGLLEAEDDFSEADIPALLGATAGSQIQGSIVTTKGNLAQEMVWRWILEYLSTGDHIEELLTRGGQLPTVDLSAAQSVAQLSDRVRACALKNGLTLTYSSEPDIAIREKSGLLLAVQEIKAGIDFAGAKERYPAAKSSFEAARSENPACHTVFVAGCMSAAVKKLVRTEGWVNRSYLLPELEMNSMSREKYLAREIRSYALR